ncbi:YbaK/prolyl-tRNA synthetase associated domain-containing protein [Bordetella holmesii]|uniref:Aminoacyl-tRNA editing domain protein n=2 Tax=Bordetella holmesii TaxID=35814 RepID=A0A158M5V5_9BORD|nr:YbaK/prolyl-tRNA synthetase associated domain-containing protein [Bordetella holmesii]AHV93900.1 ybaK / prolyl-tRNA synthetases associated domain protein [Bordetella holmesii ATCC 51541]AIT28372.1 ybaK / prolyl-tRNA synthetases associated domain protein [Bordetella holmesii 44057]EWM41161.1 ybaK / prolyl-tRNA synthetases associated domain protein [Bordetella holmesii 35009]EWM42008.1 ybaK / prolyl-tRNA synthetases associated domain protein [Bordetella holmesii 41130]EWM45051.1 ybaK / prolyl
MDVFEQLQDLLTKHAVSFRLLRHPAAGKSVEVAAIRGTEVSQGAKALVCRIKISATQRKHVLAVFPADAQADLEAIARAAGGKKAALASLDLARELTGCEIGAIPPFSFNPELQLIVDPTLRQRHDEIVFNAGRLDASILLRTEDYFRIAQPELAPLVRS